MIKKIISASLALFIFSSLATTVIANNPINTTDNCGIERTVNGITNCYADDNSVIQPGLNCAGTNGVCCRLDSYCPAMNPDPTGCGTLNANGSCQIDDVAVQGAERCGQTQTCCKGRSCPADGQPDNSENSNSTNEVDIFEGPTSENFRQLNPLVMFGSPEAQRLTSPGAIVSRMLLFAFPLAGLILFVMIVWGGFEMITGATSKGIEAGRQRVTAAVIGFTLLFVSYWIFQIIEVIFGVAIL